jgi:hypothetical protein
VSDGHAAAWIGVGDRRGWLQVGLAGYRGGALRLYYETRSPGVARRYVDLGRAVVGRSYLLAVAETARDVWSVSVDGREIATLTLRLNRRGVATSESWTSAGAPCNHYGFAVSAVATPSGWTRIGSANGTARSFTAAA